MTAVLNRDQRRSIQKAGEQLARTGLTEAWSKEDRVAVELFAYGMMDITGRSLSAYLGPECASQLFQDMADRLRPAIGREG